MEVLPVVQEEVGVAEESDTEDTAEEEDEDDDEVL